MRLASLSCLLLSLSATVNASVGKDAASPAELVKKVAASVVQIWYGDSMLTGTLISANGLVVTCAHLPVEVGKPVEVVTHGKKRFQGVVLSKLPKAGERRMGKDIALIRLKGARSLPFASVGRSLQLKEDSAVLALGYPDTLLFGSDRTKALSYARLGRPVQSPYQVSPMELVTSIFGSGGDSGGPLFDLTGSLVGVCSSGDQSGSNMKYTRIEAMLEAWEKLAGKEPRPRISSRKPLIKRSALFPQAPELIRSSVVEVRSQERWVGLGCVVGEGLILTQASELGPELRVVLNDVNVAIAEVAATDPSRDLALLRLSYAPEMTILIPKVKWQAASTPVQGAPLVLATPNTFTPLTGITCFGPEPVPAIEGIIPCATETADGGVKITELWDSYFKFRLRHPFFPLKVGDTITKVEGISIPNREAYVKLMFESPTVGRHPRVSGEPIQVTLVRNGKETTQTVVLEFAATPNSQLVRNSSLRYSGFLRAIATDIPIRPEHCGGPVVDAQGRVVGIMIGRAPFIEALFLPSSEVAKSVELMMKNLAPQ